MKILLFCSLLVLTLSSGAKAQVTAPTASDSASHGSTGEEIAFNVTACTTERIGPGQMPSGNWALVDSIIARLGKDRALQYFKNHLFDNRSATFYSLIGLYKIDQSEYAAALAEVRDEEILFQKGCLMIKKPLKEAVFMAINDR
jgi:hypothetical protein